MRLEKGKFRVSGHKYILSEALLSLPYEAMAEWMSCKGLELKPLEPHTKNTKQDLLENIFKYK